MPRTDQSRTRAQGTQTVQEDRRREKEVELYTRALARLLVHTTYRYIHKHWRRGSCARAHIRTSGDAILRIVVSILPCCFPAIAPSTIEDRHNFQHTTERIRILLYGKTHWRRSYGRKFSRNVRSELRSQPLVQQR